MRLTRVLVVAICSGRVAAAGAQVAGAGADEARELFLRGVAAAGEGRYADALADFESSYRLRPSAVVLYNIGMCRWEMGDLIEARAALQQYLEQVGETGSPELLGHARRVVGEIDRRVGFVEVAVAESGATVYLGEVEVGQSPLEEPLVVMPGRHVVEARMAGRQPARAEVAVGAGERVRVALELPELVVEDEPEPDIPADDAPSTTPTTPTTPPTLAAPIAPDTDVGWPFWLAVGLGSAAVVGAAITGSLALSSEAEFEDGGARDAELRNTAVTLAGVTDGLIGMAVAGAVAAVVLWFAGDREEEAEGDPVVGWPRMPGVLSVRW